MYLLALDQSHSATNEVPVDFSYDDQLKSLRKACEQLTLTTGMNCKLDDQVQDAYFFSQITLTPSSEGSSDSGCRLNIRLSAFGAMAAIEFTLQSPPDRKKLEESVQRILTLYGFIPVSADWLQSHQYDGSELYFLEHEYTWWHRFFEYA